MKTNAELLIGNLTFLVIKPNSYSHITELKSSNEESQAKDESDKQQLADTNNTLNQKIAALEEELGLNRDLIQTLESEKDQLAREKQDLVAEKMELVVSSESRNLAGDVLNDVEITSLKELNEELMKKNRLLEDEHSTMKSTTLEQITDLKKLNEELSVKNQQLEEEKRQFEENSETALSQVGFFGDTKSAIVFEFFVLKYDKTSQNFSILKF